jgi:hypothetical protein
MNITDIVLWGFAATLLLTTVLAVSKPVGLTRMDLPFILGTIFTSNRSKAALYGYITHLILGWFFAFIYAAAFKSAGYYTWWFGLIIGFVHGAFVLSAGIQIIAAFHPRMAQPYQGPTPTRLLEPPGLFALNYGKGTPLMTMIAHLLYGAVLGTFIS